jgi:hypothetical protein
LHDAGADVVTEVLGAASEIVDVVLSRYDDAVLAARSALGAGRAISAR